MPMINPFIILLTSNHICAGSYSLLPRFHIGSLGKSCGVNCGDHYWVFLNPVPLSPSDDRVSCFGKDREAPRKLPARTQFLLLDPARDLPWRSRSSHYMTILRKRDLPCWHVTRCLFTSVQSNFQWDFSSVIILGRGKSFPSSLNLKFK